MKTTIKLQHQALWVTLAGILCAGPGAGFADETDVSETIKQLKQQIEALNQKVQEFERQQEAEMEAEEIKAKTMPTLTIGEKGFSMRSANGDFNLRLRSLVQADSRVYFGDHDNNDGFLIRRARLELSGTVFKQFDFRVMPDFAGSSTTLLDAWVDWKICPYFQVLVGKTKMPVGLERIQSRENNLMMEFGYPTSLVPNRDIGVLAHGAMVPDVLDYYLGAVNGTTDGGSSVNNPDNGVNLVARLFANPFSRSETRALQGLGFGVAGTYGNGGGTPSNYNSVGQQTFFQWLSGTTINGATWRIDPQAYYCYGPFGLLGEYAISSQELRNGSFTGTVQNQGWQVTASYVMTGEDATFGGVKPKHPVDIANGDWGAWQIVARMTELDLDSDAFPTFASSSTSASRARSYGGGLNWYLNSMVRISGDYNYTEFQGGSLPDEQVFITRVQLRF